MPPSSPSRKSAIVGCDHAAVAAKLVVVAALEDAGLRVDDIGARGPDSVDYPDFAARVGRAVAAGDHDTGVLLCGTGIGMSIAANKVPGVRAALVHGLFEARMARAHNDANVLVLGGGLLGERLITAIVATWLETPFEGGRHQGRLDKIKLLESVAGRRGARDE